MIGTDDGIILGSIDGELCGSTNGAADGITLRIDERTELVSLYGSFDGSNECFPEVLLLGDSIGSDDKTSPGSFDVSNDGVLEESAPRVPPGSNDY